MMRSLFTATGSIRRPATAGRSRAGSSRAAAWFLGAFLCAGIALTCLVPLVARLMLLSTMERYVPTTLTVERLICDPRRQRAIAQGHLADERAATVVVPRPARGCDGDGGPLAPGTRLAVMVNDDLHGTWLWRQRVMPAEPPLSQRYARDVLRLALILLGAVSLALVAARRGQAAADAR